MPLAWIWQEAFLPLIAAPNLSQVTLEASIGEIVADFVIDEKQSVVLDLSHFRKGEQARFVTDLAERLYQRAIPTQ